MTKERTATSVYLDIEQAINNNNLEQLPGVIQMLIDLYNLDSIDNNKLDDEIMRITAKERIHETLVLTQLSLNRFIEEVARIPIKEESHQN